MPFHTWLPDAHGEAPTAGSVILAGLVLKVGAYGFLRFIFPLFPREAAAFAPWAMALGIAGILYGAVLAFGQSDVKRLVAYTSVSHMGFVLAGIFAWNATALQGVLLILISHAFSTGGLFMLVGDLYGRLHTRDLDRMGGLWSAAPRLSGFGLVLAMATLGLPGLGNFVGEFLVLVGIFRVSPVFAALATIGFIAATAYSLWMVQRAFYGPRREETKILDATPREIAIFASTVAILVWLGLWPQTVIETARPAFEALRTLAGR